MNPSHHLAQMNIARMRAPLDDPLMAGFVAQLDEVNALADRSPGFVWRLQGEGDDATDIRPFEDNCILVNMSAWESVEALREYVYGHRHGQVARDRRKWFEPLDGPYMVLWWVPAGHIPTVAEGKQRLEILSQHGPSDEAFTFTESFSPPTNTSPSKTATGAEL